MSSTLTLARFRRRSTSVAEPSTQRAADRSALLAELEVSVPAPERIVRWDTATRECPDCAATIVRSALNCRHCGVLLGSPA